MPSPTLTPGDNKERNVGQKHADELAQRFSNAEKTSAQNMNAYENSYKNEVADATQENEAIARAQENLATQSPTGQWKDNTGTKQVKTKTKFSAWFTKKRVAAASGIGGVGIIGIILGSLSGFSFLTPSLLQNSVAKNDVRSGLLDRRLVKAFEQKMGDTSGPCDTKQVACRGKKMPKVMLAAMEKKGIIAVNADGTKYSVDGTGYVDKNPHSYTITDGRGSTKTILAANFTTEYKNNAAFRKAFKGAYNMRFLGYNGAYMAKNFFKKLGLNRNGGYGADTELTETNAKEKLDKKLSPSNADTSESGAKSTFTKRLETLLKKTADKTKKTGGDPILAVGTIACTAINMPRFIAGTYRAIQAVQIAVLANELILSAGGMQQAGDAKAEAVAAIGLLLTERVKTAGQNSAKSAMDSPILQNAIGVNTNKVKINKAPGYSILTNPTVKATSKMSQDTQQTCDLINSPQAAFAVTGVEGAIGAASGGIGAVVIGALKAVGKLAIVFGAVDGIMKIAQESGFTDWLGGVAYDAAKDFIGNYVEGARGIELGDAAGMGILTTFSLAGTAGGAAVLTKDQVEGFQEVIASVDNEYRDEAVATLSPFDTSSSYTFLGSIVSNIALHSSSSNVVSSAVSALSYSFKSPLSLLSGTASAAAANTEATCGYAAEFGLDERLAINAAGYPCTGIPAQYLGMSRETAMSLVADQIDPQTGEPLEGSDLATMMSDCADSDLESLSGCTIGGGLTAQTTTGAALASTSTSTPATATLAATKTYTLCDEDGCETRTAEVGNTEEQVRAAQSIYMFDMQVEAILAGEDVEQTASTDTISSTERPDGAIDLNKGWTLAAGTDYSKYQCDSRTVDAGVVKTVNGATVRLCTVNRPYSTTDATNGSNSVASVVSTNLMNMLEAAESDGVKLGIADAMRKTFNGGYYSQHTTGLAVDLRIQQSGGGVPTICYQGVPSTQTGWGSKAAAEAACQRIGGEQYTAFQWLTKNANKYGYYNLDPEPWHWSTSGN